MLFIQSNFNVNWEYTPFTEIYLFAAGERENAPLDDSPFTHLSTWPFGYFGLTFTVLINYYLFYLLYYAFFNFKTPRLRVSALKKRGSKRRVAKTPRISLTKTKKNHKGILFSLVREPLIYVRLRAKILVVNIALICLFFLYNQPIYQWISFHICHSFQLINLYQ